LGALPPICSSIEVPWTGFELINTFNTWKKTEDAGQVFTVDTGGAVDIKVTGLPWRREVFQQVFEEAAVDLGKGLTAWSDSRCGKRKGKRVGFPRFKKKAAVIPSFRLRNKHFKDKPAAIRVGEGNRPRSITLPGIGQIAVHDDTRRLRRMLAKNRAKICFATITHHAGRWRVSLNVAADDLHGWAEFARLLKYKQAWHGGELVEADRFFPSTRLCPVCGTVNGAMTLADRVYTCGCGHSADRDANAAVNLARWGHAHHQTSPDPRTPKQRGRVTNARRRDGADQHLSSAGETSPVETGTEVRTAPAA
jgi:transposase